MDWTTIAATLAGGSIGFFGEALGRRSARKQAEHQRLIDIKERERQHDRDVKEAREQQLREASRAAINEIIKTIQENLVALLNVPGNELSQTEVLSRAYNICKSLYMNGLQITDDELRARVSICEGILDMLVTPGITFDIPIREIVFVVRTRLYEWLGSWLRQEALPPLDPDFRRIEISYANAQVQWHDWLEANGHLVRPFDSPNGT